MRFLTDSERTQLKTQHRQEHDSRVRDRTKAVLLYDQNCSPQEIAEALLIAKINDRNDETMEKEKKRPHFELTGIIMQFV